MDECGMCVFGSITWSASGGWRRSAGRPASGYYPKGVRDGLECHDLPLADVLPIDLQRHRSIGPQRDARLIMKCHDVTAMQWRAIGSEHLPEGVERGNRGHGPQREDVQAGIEPGLRAGVERAVAQIGPRRRVRHDAEKYRSGCGAVG